ncbi:MAG: hypothetical protein CL762_03185 [Chloroflexi bacterium]|nr:hypothetical protein [Chloroflexota bacterium]|tara:strand:+ start:1395 stop:2372 length:978 start_codon:yes stop_codon:yes gene_type:complete
MDFFDFKTITIFASFFSIVLIFFVVLFISKSKYFLFFKISDLEKIKEGEKLINKSLAEKERVLEIYHDLNSGSDSYAIENTLSSKLKALMNLKELRVLYLKKGSENLQILTNDDEIIVPFKKLPSNEKLKNNKSCTLKYNEIQSDAPWAPDNFVSCTIFPSFKNNNFLGVVCLFFENYEDEKLFSTDIKNLLTTAMKLIWYHENYSSNDLMESMLAESGRLNKKEENFVEIGPMKIDKNKSEVFIDGNYVDITNQEFNILELLALNKDGYVTTDDLLKDAWDTSNVSTAAVDIALFRLRQKLSKHKNGLNLIKNKTGKGYTLNAI